MPVMTLPELGELLVTVSVLDAFIAMAAAVSMPVVILISPIGF